MRKLWAKLSGLAALMTMLLPGIASAAGGKAENIVIVADSRKLDGIMAWWANMYNESHVYFTILTILLIPTIGVIFGFLADIVMSHIGIDLKSRELAEH
jgi:hypothetical protein